eukprot:2386037-Pleurochrysis_carterae.AAC.1
MAERKTALFEDFLVLAQGKAGQAAGSKRSGSASVGPHGTELLYCFSQASGLESADIKARTAAVAQFCFPEQDDGDLNGPPKLQSESFTFTLTQDDGTRCFGFSRRLAIMSDGKPICLCVLSNRAWFSLFMHMLDVVQAHADLCAAPLHMSSCRQLVAAQL